MGSGSDRQYFVLALCIVLGCAASVANATAHDWTNNYGSGDYNWFTNTNWHPTTVPGGSDSVTIDSYCDAYHYVTINTLNTTAYSTSLTLGTDSGTAGYLYIGPNAGSGGLLSYGQIYLGKDGTGVVVQNGGTVDNYSTSSTYNLYLGYSSGSGSYYLQGGTLWTHDEYIGRDNLGTGNAFFDQSGGANHIGHVSNSDGARDLFIGYCGSTSTGTGTYRLEGTGQLYLENKNGHIYVGDHYGSNQTAGRFEWFRSGGISFGSGGSAAMILDPNRTDNTLAMGYNFNIANLQSGGLIPIQGLSGATLEITNGATGSVVSGDNVSQYYLKTGTVGLSGTGSQTGGSLSVNDEYVGYGGTGVFNQTTGTHTDNWHLYIGVNDGSGNVGTGTYNLSGGTLNVGTLMVATGGGGGGGTLNQSGSSQHTVSGNAFLGSTTSAGTYKISGGTWTVDGYVSGSDNGSIIINGGSVNVTGSIGIKNFTLGDTSGYAGAFTLASGKSLTATNETIGQGGTGTFTQSGGTNSVTNLTIGSGSSYTMSGGSLTAGPVVVGQGGSATFDIGAQSPSVSSLTLKNGTIAGTTGIITATSSYVMESGSVSAKLAGGVGLTKQTVGTVISTGANTYTGTTSVTAGTLLVDGTHTGGGAYTVSNLACLGGSGSISASGLTVQNGGSIIPGDADTIGTINLVAPNVVLNGTLNVDVTGAGAGSVDLMNVTGSLNITNATVDFDVLSPLNDPAYVFVTYTTLVGGQFAHVVDLPNGYHIDYNYQSASQIALVTPEPATLALLALGGLAVIRKQRG